MLPFVNDQIRTLPSELRGYWPLIQSCQTNAKSGSVAYLTVQESVVRKGETQRTPGLHVEAALELTDQRCSEKVYYSWGGGRSTTKCIVGGIFMASTQSNTCAVLHCTLLDPATVIALHGDVEHLRSHIVSSGATHSIMKANALWWITGTIDSHCVFCVCTCVLIRN